MHSVEEERLLSVVEVVAGAVSQLNLVERGLHGRVETPSFEVMAGRVVVKRAGVVLLRTVRKRANQRWPKVENLGASLPLETLLA